MKVQAFDVYVEGVNGEENAVHVDLRIEGTETERELAVWWLRTAVSDLLVAAPKARDYGGSGGGSADLQVMGDALAVLLGWDGVPSATAQELAIWHYALGKISRLISDYQQQRPGKPDTWIDLCIYALMARRLQFAGRWP